MANRQVLLSTHLHKHRKRRTKHNLALRYGHMGRVHTSTVQASAKADARFYPGRAKLILHRDSQPPVRLDQPSVSDVQFYPARRM